MSLSLVSIIEKNRLSTDSVCILLLEISLSTGTIYLCNNNESITWDGQTWIAFPLQIGGVTVDRKEVPTLQIKVSNITREVGYALEAVDGGGGTEVILRVVNTNDLNSDPMLEEYFIVKSSGRDGNWVTINLGINDQGQKRIPEKSVMKNFCSYLHTTGFKGIECGYDGAEIACNGTLDRCRELNNSPRYGGEPGL